MSILKIVVIVLLLPSPIGHTVEVHISLCPRYHLNPYSN
jgi:hypothetical protein